MIELQFPDGSKREYDSGITGLELATQISKSLGKSAVATIQDGELTDLSDPITSSCSIEIITRKDVRSLELIRHDCAHVMAEAVQELWPETKVTIGPVIENGFYYDFDPPEPFTDDDLPKIEKRMHEIIGRNCAFEKRVVSRDEAHKFFSDLGESYKLELLDAIPAGEDVKLYSQGEWTDLCRGPSHADDKFNRQVVQADECSRVRIGEAIPTIRC